jgi:hypothetical protein
MRLLELVVELVAKPHAITEQLRVKRLRLAVVRKCVPRDPSCTGKYSQAARQTD